jgi:C4-dicarboxylate transporter DctQ subunit
VINRINRLSSIVAGLMTAVIGVVVCYAVFARYVLNQPIGWSEEIGTYLMVWAAFLGAGYTMQMDGHIGVDVVCRRLSLKLQARLNLSKYLVGIAFLVLLAWKGFEDCALSIKLGQVSISELAIPMYIPQLALPVGATMVALQLVEKLLSQLFGLGQDKVKEG